MIKQAFVKSLSAVTIVPQTRVLTTRMDSVLFDTRLSLWVSGLCTDGQSLLYQHHQHRQLDAVSDPFHNWRNTGKSKIESKGICYIWSK